MSSNNLRRIWLLVILFYPVLILLFQPADITPYDEAIILLGALQVQHGVYPGTDFFTMYGPLQFFVSAGLLSLFDDNILVLRIYHVATICLTLLLLAGLMKPYESRERLAVTLLFLVFAAFYTSKQAAPLYPTHMLSVFGAVFVAAKTRETGFKPANKIVLLGVYIALFALLAPVSAAIVVIMLIVAIPFHLFNLHSLSLEALRRELTRLAQSCGVAVLLIIGSELGTGGSLQATVTLLIEQQIPAYAEHRNLPFPTLSTNTGALFFAYFPIMSLVLGSVYYFYCAAHRSRYSAYYRSVVFWLLFFCLAFYPSGIVRTHPSQLWPTFLFSLSAAFFVICNMLDGLGRQKKARWVAPSVFSLSALLLLAFASNWLPRKTIFATTCSISELSTPRTSCLHAGTLEDWPTKQEQVKFLNEFLAADERLFVTQDRHDMIYVSHHDYYFLLSRLPLTYWSHLEPGIHTTRQVQLQIIEDIEGYISETGRAVVLIQPSRISREPNKSAVSSGVTLLDRYLADCDVAQQIGNLKVAVCT